MVVLARIAPKLTAGGRTPGPRAIPDRARASKTGRSVLATGRPGGPPPKKSRATTTLIFSEHAFCAHSPCDLGIRRRLLPRRLETEPRQIRFRGPRKT